MSFSGINLVVSSTFCSIVQNQVAQRRAKLADSRANRKISYVLEGYFSLICLQTMKFEDRP